MTDSQVGPDGGRPGPVFAIGGAEDKVKERLILRSFVEACGGADAQIVVLATASELPETGERYADLFYQLQADSVEVLRIANREDAIDAGPETLDLLEYSRHHDRLGDPPSAARRDGDRRDERRSGRAVRVHDLDG